jgi:hypothetical protein
MDSRFRGLEMDWREWVRPLVWFHLLQNVNATRDSIYCKTRQAKILLTEKREKYYWLKNISENLTERERVTRFPNRFLLHVNNSLLLTAKRDSIIDSKKLEFSNVILLLTVKRKFYYGLKREYSTYLRKFIIDMPSVALTLRR